MRQVLVYDTETTGLNRHAGAEMFAFSTAEWDGNEEVFRLDRPDPQGALARARLSPGPRRSDQVQEVIDERLAHGLVEAQREQLLELVHDEQRGRL